MSGGTADRDSTFILGRRAYINKIYQTTNYNDVDGLGNTINYDEYRNIRTSNIITKPVKYNSSSSRIQQLRLNTIGAGSLKIKDSNSETNFVKNNGDKNFVNNVITRVRGGGSIAPKKGK